MNDMSEHMTVPQLNDLVRNGGIRDLVRINEASHEKAFVQITDEICCCGAQVVMLAGPSSSGKTTAANRLATQLRVHGKQPVLLSLDDYYIDRDKIPIGSDGQKDFEHINTIDTKLFTEQFSKLLHGAPVTQPQFDFLTGKRKWSDNQLRLSERSVVIVEGLHALNPVLIPGNLAPEKVFRMYVYPRLALKVDAHIEFPPDFLRLLRRIVRDNKTRGATVQKTLSMWDSVCRGEQRWINPFRDHADVIFNSSTEYELVVLKKHILPLLAAVSSDDPWYARVCEIVELLTPIETMDVEDEIPPTSLVREFIGGNTFYK